MDWHAAIAQVVRWGFVSETHWPHRLEPFLHERTWAFRGCELSAEEAEAARGARRVGYDARGRPIIVGPARIAPELWESVDAARAVQGGVAYEGDAADLEVVTYVGDAVEVTLEHGATTVRTTFDPAGRQVRTEYRGAEEGEERYAWDGAGRLVEIHEDEAIFATTMRGSRLEGGGQLAVEHDVDGPLRIVDDYGYLVWERCDEPWSQLLDRGVGQIADAAIEATKEACRRYGVDGETEVFSMMLSILGDSTLDFGIFLGLGANRRRWLASGMTAESLSYNLWHLDQDAATPQIFPGDTEIVPSDLDRLMLQEGGLNQPHDAKTVILNAVAAALSRNDWRGVMRPTEDFVVYRMGHDEGLRWAYASVHAANPAERVAAWERNWPRGVPRGEHD